MGVHWVGMGLWGFPMRPPPLPPRASPRTHSKTVQRCTNQAIPPLSPARTGPGGPLRPRTNMIHDVDQGAQGLEVIWSVYAGRREGSAPQCRAFRSPARACSEPPQTVS